MSGPRRLLVIADSLSFHGPAGSELLSDPRIYPNVAAAELGAEADILAQVGWTSRHAWRSLTRDPRVYSFLVPTADAVLLAVGGMDYLPSALPTYWREGIAYLRPPPLRRLVRRGYLAAQPRFARATRGRLRAIPQSMTDAYLTRCVTALRAVRPGIPVLGIVPPPHRAASYALEPTGHPRAAAAARTCAERSDVPLVDVSAAVAPHLAAGRANPDGMHFGWEAHRDVGLAVAEAMRRTAGW